MCFTKLNGSKVLALFLFFSVLYLVLSIIGGVHRYTPVPISDMWNGYLGFLVEVENGNQLVWLSQHNEHRILLSRILFWLDLKLFGGQVYFLIIMNYLLAGLGFLVIYKTLEEILPNDDQKFTRYLIGSVIFCLLFSWMQKENLVWGFQSQFFLAQSLPLLALYLLHRSLFIPACLTGFLSIWSMGNGILALPLMIVYALIMRLRFWQIGVLISLTIFAGWVYFADYISPIGHGTLKQALMEDPAGLLHYLLYYLGSPFSRIPGTPNAVLKPVISTFASVFLILSGLYFSWKNLKSPRDHSLQVALILYLLYIGGTALGTGAGRVIFGVEQAFSERYTTPVLMAWSVLLVLYAPMIAEWIKQNWKRSLVLLIIPLAFLPQQVKALKSKNSERFEKYLAALSLELGVKDLKQFGKVGPEREGFYQYTYKLSQRASKENLSIFNDPLIKDLSQKMGTRASDQTTLTCQGQIELSEKLSLDSEYIRISGHIIDHEKHKAVEQIQIVNEDGIIVGYALARKREFKGYMTSKEMGKTIYLQTPECALTVTVPFS